MQKVPQNTEAIEIYKNAISPKSAESTVDRYVSEIERFAEWLRENHEVQLLPPSQVAEGDGYTSANFAKNYLSELESEGYAGGTIQAKHAAISGFYRELGKDSDPNPTDSIDITEWNSSKSGTKKSQHIRDKEAEYLTQAEIDGLIDNASEPFFRNSLILRLLVSTGVRCGELCQIRINDVQLDDLQINIYADKTRDYRPVYIQSKLVGDIRRWLESFRETYHGAEDSEYLFPTHRSERISSDQIRAIVNTAAENAGIQEVLYTDNNGTERVAVTPHTLRHTFAVHCIKNGMDIVRLAELLGHWTEDNPPKPAIETTREYLKFKQSDIARVARDSAPRP